jgi:hypothetical protein
MKTFFLFAVLTVSVIATSACGDYHALVPSNQPPPFASAEAMQAEFLKRFLDAPGFGMRRVLVPEYHRPAPYLVWNEQRFAVKPPELIGLEEHDDPVAYVLPFGSFAKADFTNKLSRSLVKTRELNSFEAAALDRLRRGQSIIAEERAETGETIPPELRLRVLGAIRATSDCLDCHSGGEGKLLGAFSYVLTPVEKKVTPLESLTNSVPASASPGLAASISGVLR